MKINKEFIYAVRFYCNLYALLYTYYHFRDRVP